MTPITIHLHTVCKYPTREVVIVLIVLKFLLSLKQTKLYERCLTYESSERIGQKEKGRRRKRWKKNRRKGEGRQKMEGKTIILSWLKLVSKYSSFMDILDPANDLKISAHQKLQENVSIHSISNVWELQATGHKNRRHIPVIHLSGPQWVPPALLLPGNKKIKSPSLYYFQIK